MTRRLLATLALAAALLLTAPAVASAAPAPPSRLVVVVLAPYLTWEDVQRGDLPYLSDLVDESAVGNLNVNSLAQQGPQSPENGTLMLSAGAWTRWDASAPRTRESSDGIVYLGMAQQVAAQEGSGVTAEPRRPARTASRRTRSPSSTRSRSRSTSR
jgi:hypothetical protein